MLRPFIRLLVLALLAPWAAGCLVGFKSSVVVTVVPGGLPAATAAPAPVLPGLALEFGGQAVESGQTHYRWGASGTGTQGDLSAAAAGASVLSVPAGQSVDIVIRHPVPPAVLWIVELDSQGVPAAASTLQPAAGRVQYPLVHSGPRTLQVTAQWAYDQYVMALFPLSVEP